MNVTISFKHLEHTDAVDNKIREKSMHFEKYLEGVSHVKWICSLEDSLPVKMHVAEVHVSASMCNFFAKAEAENLYKCLDAAADKMEKQLRRHKEKWHNRLHEEHEVEILDPEKAWGAYPEVEWGDFKKAMDKEHPLD